MQNTVLVECCIQRNEDIKDEEPKSNFSEVGDRWDELVLDFSRDVRVVRVPKEDFERCIEEIKENDQCHECLPNEQLKGLGVKHGNFPKEILEFRDCRVLRLETLDFLWVETFVDIFLHEERLKVLRDVKKLKFGNSVGLDNLRNRGTTILTFEVALGEFDKVVCF